MKLSLLGLLALLATLLPARAADQYRTYLNARFGTVVEYPANLVFPQPESENGDGRRFVSKDKQIEFTVYASYNALNRSVGSQMAHAAADWKHDGAHVTYYKYGPSWYAVSGYIGDDIFYEKSIFKSDAFHTVIWQYPKIMKKRLDAVVNRSTHSLRVGQQSVAMQKAKVKPTPSPAPPVGAGY